MKSSGKIGLGFALSITAGITVILNAAALLSNAFYSLWVGVFFWIPVLDASPQHGLVFAIGAIIGLLVIIGSFLILVGYSKAGGILVSLFCVLSLIIGGGYVFGFIIGLIGGSLSFKTSDTVRFRSTPQGFMFCRDCGARIIRESKYCAKCGSEQYAEPDTTRAF